MTMLSICATAALRVGLPSLSAIAGNSNDNAVRLLALANEEGEDLSQRHRWQILTREATFTTLATESQGLMTALAGSDFQWLNTETVWDRDSNEPWHVMDDTEWQRSKANAITGPYPRFRIRGGYMIAIPTPTAGHTVAFEYQSANWATAQDGTTGKSSFTADDDTAKLSEPLMTLGVVWRWKKMMGLDYAENFRTYQMQVANHISRDGASKRITMNARGPGIGIRPSEGNWSI